MRKIYVLILTCMTVLSVSAQVPSFVRGADVSWCSEMEADGMKFYASDGTETDLFALMQQIGMNTIRLRVWVNPENKYGPWSDKADVLAKALRAKEAGLDILIDFHYSDYFADPGRQTKPAAWTDLSFEDLKAALAAHTINVLQTLKNQGVEPRWVQVGNETTSGMVWEDGRIDWNQAENTRWLNYVALSNAGYEAVKSVLPNAYVIVHHDNAQNDQTWFYQAFKQYGGKFDMIGLSHYPEWDNWSEDNTASATYLRKLHNTFFVPVMIVETGYSNWDEARAERVMKDLFAKMLPEQGCAGILYWEPEVYGGWGHLINDDGSIWHNTGTYGKKETCNGAFTPYGQPAPALLVFGDEHADSQPVLVPAAPDSQPLDLFGRPVSDHFHGLIIQQGKKYLR